MAQMFVSSDLKGELCIPVVDDSVSSVGNYPCLGLIYTHMLLINKCFHFESEKRFLLGMYFKRNCMKLL